MTSHPPSDSEMSGYQLHPEVVWIARPDGSARLMHMSANVCAIDADSTVLLTSILERGLERSATELAAREAIDVGEARQDVRDFVADLCKQKLIQPIQHRTSPLDQVRDGAARALVPGAIRLANLAARTLNGRIRGLLWAAKWTVAQFGWARAIREWERVYPQPAAEKLATIEELDTIDHSVRQAAARSLFGVECKERSLVCLALARGSGIPAQLIVGVAHNPMQGHVWVEAQGRVISDDPDHYRSFEPVARYG